jgi:sulfur carrier protein ThiS
VAWSIATTATSGGDGNSTSGGQEGSEQSQQLLVAQVLAWPAGVWLVGAAGVVLVVVGVLQFVLLFRRGYTTEIDLEGRSPGLQRAIHALAWYGYTARGVILGVLGYFLLRSAWTHDPSQAGDTDTAFDFIGGGVIGDSAFFVVAVGTIAYGLFMYANAKHYRFGGAEPGIDR